MTTIIYSTPSKLPKGDIELGLDIDPTELHKEWMESEPLKIQVRG